VATTVTVLVIPAVMFCVLLAVQFALVYHARHVATAAAQDAVWTATAQHGTTDDARRVATELIDSNAHGLLDHPTITVTPDGDRVRVEITADVVALVPGTAMRITATADTPTERFTQPDQP
jgi:Flp pilus assembly protein TadG